MTEPITNDIRADELDRLGEPAELELTDLHRQVLATLRANDAGPNPDGLTPIGACLAAREAGQPIDVPLRDVNRGFADLRGAGLIRYYRGRTPRGRRVHVYRLTAAGYELAKTERPS